MLKNSSSKTEVVIFNKSGHLIYEKIAFENSYIECVNRYKYLAIFISSCDSFKVARSDLFNKALKASLKLFKDRNSTQPPIKTFLHLSDQMIKSTALFGCEICGPLI